MICPSCKQTATSFLRNAFSSQGVSTFKSMQGYLKCQQCGTLLRVTSYSKHFWFFLVATVIVLVLYTLFYQRLFSIVGFGATALLWIVLILLIFTTYTFGLWKYGRVQKADSDNHSRTNEFK